MTSFEPVAGTSSVDIVSGPLRHAPRGNIGITRRDFN